jgi:hypothetical protein
MMELRPRLTMTTGGDDKKGTGASDRANSSKLDSDFLMSSVDPSSIKPADAPSESAAAAVAAASPETTEPAAAAAPTPSSVPAAAALAQEDSANGLDTLVAAGGSNFSVGERQKLCLARALLKSTSILCLDESNASLDSQSDRLILETIRREFQLKRSTTIIQIAHRLSSVVDSNMIVVMHEGMVKEQGHPKDLMDDASGYFHSMCKKGGEAQYALLYAVASGKLSASDMMKLTSEQQPQQKH